MGCAEHLKLQAGKRLLQPLFDQADGEVGDVNADPLAPQLLCGVDGGAAPAERIKHYVAGIAAGLNDALQQGQRLLGGVAEAFGGLTKLAKYPLSHLEWELQALLPNNVSVAEHALLDANKLNFLRQVNPISLECSVYLTPHGELLCVTPPTELPNAVQMTWGQLHARVSQNLRFVCLHQ